MFGGRKRVLYLVVVFIFIFTRMNTQNAEQIMKRGSTLDKPKKTPRVRVIMSAKELSPNWADHEVHSNYRRPRIKFSDARPTSQESENDSDEERDSSKHPEDCEGASDDTTGEESDVMSVDVGGCDVGGLENEI